jgi:hypothetical protein
MELTRTGSPGTGTSRHRWAKVASTTTSSVIAKTSPMHWCRPPPKGTNDGRWVGVVWSADQRSGSKTSGCG